MELKNKKVLVVGAARTGIAVARFLCRQGADVTLADTKTEKQLGETAREIEAMDVRLALGPHSKLLFPASDLIVISPGVPHSMAFLVEARSEGIPVIGEIELAGRFIEEPIVAITGTNGKTTTTELVGDMLRASGLGVYVGGNIGRPLIDYVDEGKKADVVVAEVSSYQLDTIETFRPHTGVLLNISEDHLDRYDGFAAYMHSKARLFKNQYQTDFAILNRANLSVCQAGSEIEASVLYFDSTSNHDGSHAWKEEGEIVCALPGGRPMRFDMSRFALEGIHNLENAAAAILAALTVGATVEGVQKTLESFKGLHHRVEYIRTHNGVRYFNDSKGTNVDAVLRALQSFRTPIVLIMGGRDKGGDYSPLKELVADRVRKLVVIGEAREIISHALGDVVYTEEAPSLDAAVKQASLVAQHGDTVLLSPGCSSFDMFTDYEERGEVFRQSVERL